MSTLRNEIEIAVKWWGNQLRRPCEHACDLSPVRTRLMNPTSLKPLEEEKIQAFERCLTEILTRHVQDNPYLLVNPYLDIQLFVDYLPDRLFLGAAAKRAGIDPVRLPIKKIMTIKPNSVQVSGMTMSGRKVEELYPH
jgi:hypothetical protein